MKQKQRKIVVLVAIIAIANAVVPQAKAMHIMEGFLQPKYCIAWGILCIPFLIWGYYSLKKLVNQHRKALIILAMVGAYVFVISALKIPSVTGSSSHPTGTGLGAILFGPSIMSIIGIIVLLFQAVLLAHGGLTTLGANTFSMAIAGPILSFWIYKGLNKIKAPKMVAVFAAAMLGDLFTYCVTSVQLGLAYPSAVGGVGASIVKFLGVFAVTQVPISVVEGILTVLVVMSLETYAKAELLEIGFLKESVAYE